VAFTPGQVLYILDFTGTELDGLTVEATSTTIGGLLSLSDMIDDVGELPDPDAAPSLDPKQVKRYAAAMAKFRRLVDTYADVLVSWDLEIPAGNPVSADAEGMLRLSPRHLMMIIKAYQVAVSQVPAELGKDSTGGAPSPVASLPMEPLSPSLAS
jgi:hypothetical protein